VGDAPSSIDATAYAFLANLLWAPFDNPIRAQAQQQPNLEQYCQRMKGRYYVG
jgi:glutathione S-transferase